MSMIREQDTNRLRASLRGLLPAVVTFVLLLIGSMGLGLVFDMTAEEFPPGEAIAILLAQILLIAVSAGVAVGVAMRLDRRPYTTFGLDINREWIRDFLAGVIITILAALLVFGFADLRGFMDVSVEVSGVSGSGGPLILGIAFVVILGFMLINNIYEEIVFRGIMLQNFAEGLRARGISPIWAVVLAVTASLLVFGAYHIPRAEDAMMAFTTSALRGIVFAVAYILTGKLGLPLGVHFGGVFLESALPRGRVFYGFELPTILVLEASSEAPQMVYEFQVVFVFLSCLFIFAWVYLVYDEVRVAETIYQRDIR